MITNHCRRASVQLAASYEKRRGIALVMALVVMAVLTVILAFVAKEIVTQRLALEQRQRRLQAQWLARAGVEIAAARLLDGPEAFALEMNDVLADIALEIRAAKLGKDLFAVITEAKIGDEIQQTASSAQAQFHLSQRAGATRLKSVSPP